MFPTAELRTFEAAFLYYIFTSFTRVVLTLLLKRTSELLRLELETPSSQGPELTNHAKRRERTLVCQARSFESLKTKKLLTNFKHFQLFIHLP